MIKNRIVVKVGTSTITNESGAIDFRAIDNLCKVLAGVENNGYEVVLVSSGAIAVGSGFKNEAGGGGCWTMRAYAYI